MDYGSKLVFVKLLDSQSEKLYIFHEYQMNKHMCLELALIGKFFFAANKGLTWWLFITHNVAHALESFVAILCQVPLETYT